MCVKEAPVIHIPAHRHERFEIRQFGSQLKPASDVSGVPELVHRGKEITDRFVKEAVRVRNHSYIHLREKRLESYLCKNNHIFANGMKKYIIVFLISMVPLIELRGAIPYAVGFDLPTVPSYIIAVLGNMIPVPFIFFFARRFLEWGKDKKAIGGFCRWSIGKGEKGRDKLLSKSKNGIYIALLLFVGIPLPGTGAWTGTLAASFLNLDFKKSVLVVMAGVILAGCIMLAASFGVFGAISLFG